MSQSRPTLTMYSDYVCPFCYLGRRSLEQYRESEGVDPDIDWRPFDLRSGKRGPNGEIDDSVEDGKDEAYFEQARENVDRLREQYDAEEMLGLDEIPDVDSLDAQVASQYVEDEHPDRWRAFDDALFEALWVEGRDVGDIGVLASIAEDAGIDGEEIREAVADEDRRDRVFEAFSRAKEDGITGVPTFVHDGHAARGAVPPEHLKRLIQGT